MALNMKKICFITTVSMTLKAFVLEIAEYLNKKGDYEITFICDTDDGFKSILPDYIRYIPVPMKRGVSIDGLKAIFQMYKIFKKEKFDLVQYSTPNASLYASIAGFLARINVRLYAQWGIRYVGLSGISREVFKLFEKISCGLATHIRGQSKKNVQFAIDEGLCQANKIKVLGQGGTIGVDLSVWDIQKKDIYRQEIKEKYNIKDEFIFGYVGRVTKDKGTAELLNAFKNLLCYNTNVKLFIVGSNEYDNKIKKDLYTWAVNCENIIFTGKVQNIEISKYYSAFDCYVHPTYREGFGLAIQEAAAMENTIITTNVPGASEVMENNISCLLVESKNVLQLESAMKKVLSESNLSISLGKNARERVEKYFDRKIMLENLYKDYSSILFRKEMEK